MRWMSAKLRIVKCFALVFFVCVPAAAQLSYGLIAGVPFNGLATGSGIVDKSGSFTIGPTIQIGLPLGFRVEADALYRSTSFTFAGVTPSAAQWRFPLLVQYRLSAPIVKPFVEAGYSYDHVDLRIQSVLKPAVSITSHHGFVMGAGVDFKVPFVRISPELRYTRDINAGSSNVLQLNQAEFLVGLRF
jgi:hypothetical protein